MKRYPFKFLDSYNREDRGIFFGRDEEISDLYEMVFQSSVMLVYGASGTGKTSLINCGLAGKFQPHDWLALMIRRGNNINDSLEKALNDAGGNISTVQVDTDWHDEWSDESETTTVILSPVARSIKAVYQKSFRPVYLIFDQFEELFILGSINEQELFINTVQDILQSEQPVKLIFSIREEYLGHLFEFERAVPQLLRKKLRIEPMNLEKVKQVIIGAAEYEHSNIRLKPGESEQIAEGIFDKIKGKGKSLTIQLPFLQVFLDKFYMKITGDESREADAEFSLQKLNDMGEIGDVLINFLEEQVAAISKKLKGKYPALTPEMTWKILSPFTTLEGTKEPISKKDLIDRLQDYDAAMIDEVVHAFINSRILRYNEATDMFEIAHDSLAKPIAEKRSVEETALLEIKRLIKSVVAEKEARAYFTEKQLLRIEPYLEKFKESNEEQDWIARSRTFIQEQKELEKKKQQEELTKTRKRLRQTYSILSVALLALIAAGYFWFNSYKQKKLAVEKTLIAETTLAQNKKIINAFYFYADRFALAFKDEVFYFIDKNGDEVTKLGKWDKAEQFNDIGFAKVVDDDSTFLLDTSGVSYKVVYDIKDIDTSVRAIDLSFKDIDSIPGVLLANKALQVLILSNNYLISLPKEIGELKNLTLLSLAENQLTSLPKEIWELKNLTSLVLNNNQLTNLPKEIGELKNLTSLVLNNNQLTNLPKEIGELKNLTSLSLAGNNLTSLPKEIAELKNLTSLDLDDNQLTNLPKETGELKNLTSLYLSGNNLISLPKEIRELKNLTSLVLSKNKLTSLLKEIGELKSLIEIDLSGDSLNSLPKEIGELNNLTSLGLDGNKLISLPKEIGELKNLTSLVLNDNQLTNLPKEIGELKNLTSLVLNDNQLTNLPKEIGELKNLISLVLNDNQLTNLPKEIGELKNLTALFLSGNKLTSLPKEIAELKNLTVFDFSRNKLTSLPKEFWELKNLRVLSLAENNLTSLPKEIGELKNLTGLFLSGNKLTSLPKEMGELKNLTSLYLAENKLTSLPKEIGELKNLTYLFLDKNQLTSLPKEIVELKNLRSLVLNDNQFTSLPNEIEELKNLSSLGLGGNKLTSLPKEIGELKNLGTLFLTGNPIPKTEIAKIKKLLPTCEIFTD